MLEVPRARRYSLVLLLAATAHASNATSRLAFGSCSKVHLPQPLWPYVRARSPKAWIWAGDAVYGDRLVRALPLTFEAMGPQYLRDAYATQNAIPEYARLREEVPYFIASWDDHDFGLNDGGGDLPWRDASQAVFLAAMNLSVPSGQHGVYTRTRVPVEGGAVLVVALDLRYHKSPYTNVEGDFLGEAQWAWLVAKPLLQNYPATLVTSGSYMFASAGMSLAGGDAGNGPTLGRSRSEPQAYQASLGGLPTPASVFVSIVRNKPSCLLSVHQSHRRQSIDSALQT